MAVGRVSGILNGREIFTRAFRGRLDDSTAGSRKTYRAKLQPGEV